MILEFSNKFSLPRFSITMALANLKVMLGKLPQIQIVSAGKKAGSELREFIIDLTFANRRRSVKKKKIIQNFRKWKPRQNV